MTAGTEDVVTPKKRRRFFLLGPPAVILSFAHTLTEIVFTDLIVYRTCLVSLNISSTECSMLRDNASSPEAMDLETRVEPYASVIVMTNSLIRTILPAILALFLGPWSDRAGRRPLLLTTFCGTILMFTTLTLMCNWDISPWYLLLASIPGNMVGGLYTGKLAMICYVSDTSINKNKAVHMTGLEGSFTAGIFLGGIAGPFIYKNYGYIHIFAIVTFCHVFSLVYTYFWIPETVKNTSKESIRGLFKISSVKELLAGCFVKREGFNRSIVWLSIFILTLNSVIRRGDATINFLFTRARLGWDVQPFFYFHAAEAVIRLIGMSGVLLGRRYPGASDTLFAFISFISALGYALTKSMAWKSWHMYLAASIAVFSGVTIAVMRSVISRFVPTQDVGKVFALVMLLEIFGAFGGPALYTLIYSNYLPPIYPSPVYLLSVSLYIILLIFVLAVELLIRKHRKPPLYIPAAQEEDPRQI